MTLGWVKRQKHISDLKRKLKYVIGINVKIQQNPENRAFGVQIMERNRSQSKNDLLVLPHKWKITI